jgi:uncharacterized membrane protein
MKFKTLVDNLVIIAIILNISEKIVSYVGQKNFPETIFEGNIYTAPLIQQFGLELGHIIPLIGSLTAIFLFRETVVYVLPHLERYPIRKEAMMCIVVFALLFLTVTALCVLLNNLYLVWINLMYY